MTFSAFFELNKTDRQSKNIMHAAHTTPPATCDTHLLRDKYFQQNDSLLVPVHYR